MARQGMIIDTCGVGSFAVAIYRRPGTLSRQGIWMGSEVRNICAQGINDAEGVELELDGYLPYRRQKLW
jgi:hypothetical protein